MPVLNGRALTAGLLAALAGAVAILCSPAVAFRLPGHNQGYAPAQPIAFSHKLHAGTLSMACQYCHFNAERGMSAGVPPVATCLNCHRYVDPNHSPELGKLYRAAGLKPDRTRDPKGSPQPVAWNRVHTLPEFVRFDHSRHVIAGVICQTCHGPVESMDRIRQAATLAMGMCVNCHRTVNHHGVNGRVVHASVDCVSCHY